MTVPSEIISEVLLVIQTISLGYVPTVACDRIGLSYSTFVNYTREGELARLRSEAEDRLYDLMAEALPNIFDHHIYGKADAKEAVVISGNIKWLLERRRQKVYGAHSVIEHQITADKEVLDALNRAKARAHGLIGQVTTPIAEGAMIEGTIREGDVINIELDESDVYLDMAELEKLF